MSQRCEYHLLKHAVRDLLKQNARSLAAGAGGTIRFIECVNPEAAQIPADRFPALCIYRRAKAPDEAVALGGYRAAEVTIEITAMVVVGEDAERADDYVESLADNIEALLRANPKLGTTSVAKSKVGETRFETVREEEGASIIALAQLDLLIVPFMN